MGQCFYSGPFFWVKGVLGLGLTVIIMHMGGFND